MTKIHALAVVSAFLLVGTAFGQAPAVLAPPPAGVPWSPPDGASWQPPAATAPPDAHAGEAEHLWGAADAHGSEPWRIWGSAGYFLGWVKGDPLPVLVTSSTPGTPQTQAGVLGLPTTIALFGGRAVNTQARSGLRADFGVYIDSENRYAVEAGFFGMETQASGVSLSSNGTTILARPFTDVTGPGAISAQAAFPGVSSGSIRAVDSARNMLGGHIDLRESFFDSCWVRCDALLGYSSLRYDERLQVQHTVVPLSGPFTAGTTLVSTDNFAARNIFNGVDLGFRNEFFYQSLSLETYGKVAVGVLNRTTTINGSQVVTVPGTPPVITQAGLLALSTNSGIFPRHTDTAVPELGLILGWQITDNIRFRAGYSVLWWMNVVRPGTAIDPFVNSTLLPGGTNVNTPVAQLPAGTVLRPSFTGVYSDLWVQAITFSLEFRY